MNKPKTKQHTLNQSQLKSLTDNLKLRLRYAKLKVVNGWHNQTLNEIESTIYYLLPHKHSNQQRQATKKQSTTPKQKLPLLEGPSLSSSTSSGSSKSSEPHGPLTPSQFKPLGSIHPPLARSFNFPRIPSSLSKPTLDQPSSNPLHQASQQQVTSDQSNLEKAFLIQKSHLLSSTTLTLPLKYSTPFKKSMKLGDQSDQLSTESSRFWPTRTLDCPPTDSASPIRFNGSSRKSRKYSLEGLVLKMAGMDSKTSSKETSGRTGGFEESDDLFKTSSMEDFHELYKQSSPASFLFNYHQRSILDSSSAKKSSKTNLLNSVSPVRMRSNLHHQSYPHPRLARLASNSLASPTPTRTQKPHLNKIFASTSTSKNDHDSQRATDSAQLLPGEDGEEDDDEDEEDKENWMELDGHTPHKPSPLKLRSSLLKFKLHPSPPSSATHPNPSLNNNNNKDNQINEIQMEDIVYNPTQIGLDELDQLVWE